MKIKLKKTYTFAFWSSIYIATFATLSFFLVSWYFQDDNYELKFMVLFAFLIFVFTFVVTQYRLEKFIYQRIKKIYDSVRLLDESDLEKTIITSDIATLSAEVQKFAEQKQLQIKKLNLRESYRREFLGNVSHELKTPLFTVQGYLLTLADGAINDKKIRNKYVKRANKGVERLIAIVQDLDLISKLESDDLILKKESFNLITLIEDVFEMLEMKAKKRDIQLCFNKNYEEPVLAFADVEQVERVLTNLVVNSIKYGKKNGTTKVSVEPFKQNKLLIKVVDNGEGIKKEDQNRVFERFYRVDKSRSRDQGGSGLGLSIVKHIIEAHKENIFLKSSPKKTEFSFTLEKAKNT